MICKRGGLDGDPSFLQLFGDIYMEVLDDVDHIEVATSQSAYGYLEGHTESYNVNGFTDENKYWLGDTVLWKLPFVVNKTNTVYTFTVTYFCGNEDNPSDPLEGASTTVQYFPGDLCDDGDVWVGDEFLSPDVSIDNNSQPGMQVTDGRFDLDIKTRIPEGGIGVYLLVFPLEEIESSTVELTTKSGDEFVKP